MADFSTIQPEAGIDGNGDTSLILGRVGRRGKGLPQELVEALSARLKSGLIKPGDKLPPESEIMQTFGVSRGVVR